MTILNSNNFAIIVNGTKVGSVEEWQNTENKFSAEISLLFAIGEPRKVSPSGIKIPPFCANTEKFEDLSKVELNKKINDFLFSYFNDFQIVKN